VGIVTTPSALLRAGRPRQWTKNLLVFTAPGAAGTLDEGAVVGSVVVTFLAMCLASTGTYFVNDLVDLDADRRHPTKRHRPLASGAVSLRAGRIAAAVTLSTGVALGFGVTPLTGVAVSVYVLLTLSYSVVWKRIAVVDLVAVASGFVLRAVAGAWAADVEISTWFLLFVTFGSLLVVTGKREAELIELGDEGGTVRATLDHYTRPFLRMVLSIAATAALVVYCLWAFEASDGASSDLPWYELSIVPMLTAVLRYLLVLEQGRGAAPEEVFLSDRTLQIVGAIWVLVFAAGVYAS
jgi:decaprenyl-phosphate phosphoribosyltransferase